MSKHRILFVVTNFIVFNAYLPVIRQVERNNIDFDVLLIPLERLGNNLLLVTGVAEYAESFGYTVLREIPQNREYDVAYSPYPTCFKELAQSNSIKYHVRLTYSVSGANKPHLSCPQSIFNFYDYVLCFCKQDAAMFAGHAETRAIGNIKLAGYQRTRITPADQKTILYLPTWGTSTLTNSSAKADLFAKLEGLRDKYQIIAKMHIATAHFKEERKRRDLFSGFDGGYDDKTTASDMLNDADVVLSDLSSAAFDAIAGDVPLALFGLGEPVYYGGKLCLHQQLVKDDIIPGTNDINELESVIEKALSPEYFTKQQQLKKEMFPYEGQECLDAFMRFQNDLFEDRVDPWYIATRRALREDYLHAQKQAQTNLNKQKEMFLVLQKQIEQYETSSSWKLTAPLRRMGTLARRIVAPIHK